MVDESAGPFGHNREPDFYCATYVREEENAVSVGVAVCRTIDEVRGVLDGKDLDNLADRPNILSTSTGEESDLELDLSHFFQSLQKYYELADISENLGPIFLHVHFKNQIQKFLSKQLLVVEEYADQTIYALDEHTRMDLDRRVNKWADMQAGVASLAPSILLGLVASYDSLFASLFSELLLLRPERYNSSERQLSVSEILRLSSFDDVLRKVVNDEVESVTSKGHVDQIAIFEKSFSVDVIKSFTKWPEFVEIFERRNLAAHGDLKVDEKYISNCKRAGLDTKKVKEGDDLKVNQEYLARSVDTLVDLGTRLVFAAWHKQAPADRESAYNAVVNITFEFIKADRYDLAESVADFVLTHFKATGQDGSLKAIVINRGIALKKLGKVEESKNFLEKTDWTAASPIYNLCVAGVVEDLDTAIRLLPVVHAMKDLGPTEIRTWPAFDWIKSNSGFAEAFQRVFDEPLVQAQAIESPPSVTTSE